MLSKLIAWYFLSLRARARILNFMGLAAQLPKQPDHRVRFEQIDSVSPVLAKRIYVISSASTVTGGPEAIHQCVGALRAQGHEAYVVYVHDTHPQVSYQSGKLRFTLIEPNLIALAYSHYGAASATEVILDQESLVIVPEIMLNWLPFFQHCQRAIWWLSVDAAFHHAHGIKSVWGGIHALKHTSISHLCQSAYAHTQLRSLGLNPRMMLSDYTTPLFLENPAPLNGAHGRKPKILVNGSKGIEFVRILQEQLAEYEIILLKGFSKPDLRSLMLDSMIYVDFGHHPGKDRLPREAALCGLVVMVRLRGAVLFEQDVPVPEYNRFTDEMILNGELAARIKNVINNFDDHQAKMAGYSEIIQQEKMIFENEVRQIFSAALSS